ncbi:MAG: helix-turn-helix domain-containing protein [Thermoflexales bacterium]|nr:helix-turn-helix domain-containing protein [Thermoflexales bacterium]
MAKRKSPDKRLPVVRGYTRNTGYVKLWREMYTCYGRRLGLEAIALWAFLRDHVNRANGLAWPGYRLIQETFGVSRRDSIKLLVASLEAAGLVETSRAVKAIPDPRERRELGINDRSNVYVVHDPPASAEFATLTHGRECKPCPFLERCKSGQALVEGGGHKMQPPPPQGEASPEGGCKMQPPVVADCNHNKHDVVVVAGALDQATSDLSERMTRLKVAEQQQQRLLQQFTREYLLQKLAMVEHKFEAGDLSNPAGWFIRACQEDWLPAPEAPPSKSKKRKGWDDEPPECTKHYY